MCPVQLKNPSSEFIHLHTECGLWSDPLISLASPHRVTTGPVGISMLIACKLHNTWHIFDGNLKRSDILYVHLAFIHDILLSHCSCQGTVALLHQRLYTHILPFYDPYDLMCISHDLWPFQTPNHHLLAAICLCRAEQIKIHDLKGNSHLLQKCPMNRFWNDIMMMMMIYLR